MTIAEDAITDLKQFIVATISQQMSNVATKDDIARLDQKIDEGITQVRQDIADLQGFIGEAIDTSNNAHDEQLKNHEKRLIRLERKLA